MDLPPPPEYFSDDGTEDLADKFDTAFLSEGSDETKLIIGLVGSLAQTDWFELTQGAT